MGANQKNKNKYMKKIAMIITAALILVTIVCFLSKDYFAAKPVSKNIDVEVYKTASYVSPAYSDAYATLEVTVVKVSGNKRDTAFQHTFAPKQLKDYPASDKPMIQKITIPNVNDKKEKLEVYYKLTYDSKGSVLNFLNTATIGKGQQSGKLNIQI